MNVQLFDHNRGSETGQSRATLASVSPHGAHSEQLARKLGVTPAQSGAWRELVAALEIDARLLPVTRITSPCALDQAHGSLEQRLAKLSMMQAAAARLLVVLEPHQRQSAERLLPLCCLRRVH